MPREAPAATPDTLSSDVGPIAIEDKRFTSRATSETVPRVSSPQSIWLRHGSKRTRRHRVTGVKLLETVAVLLDLPHRCPRSFEVQAPSWVPGQTSRSRRLPRLVRLPHRPSFLVWLSRPLEVRWIGLGMVPSGKWGLPYLELLLDLGPETSWELGLPLLCISATCRPTTSTHLPEQPSGRPWGVTHPSALPLDARVCKTRRPPTLLLPPSSATLNSLWNSFDITLRPRGSFPTSRTGVRQVLATLWPSKSTTSKVSQAERRRAPCQAQQVPLPTLSSL
mmetsp:Transcript_94382/g.197188  ORF Transcript_94382/g.197188 Transcript_94382/m.197188 type:complete len:279 (-) Transcript_94382:49-885(-)